MLVTEFVQYFLFCLTQTLSGALQLVLSPILFAIERSKARRKTFSSVLITGGSSGLGAALAVGLSKPGVHIAITGRNLERLKQIEKDCKGKGATVSVGVVDVANIDALNAFIDEVDAEHPFDLVVANAGVTGFAESPDEKYTFQQSVIDVNTTNVIGVTNTILPIIPRMCARKNGQVAIMASLSSLFPLQAAPDYSGTKANVLTLGRALRGYLAPHKVGLSVICPGFVRTALLTSDKKYPMEITSADAVPIMIDGLERDVGVICFPTMAYLLVTFIGNMHPISYSVLGPMIFTRLSKKVTARLTGIESKKRK